MAVARAASPPNVSENSDLLDIGAAADQAVALIRRGQVSEGVEVVEDARRGRSQVIQDALDRCVSARMKLCVRPPDNSGPDVAEGLARIDRAGIAYPRMPVAAQTAVLSEQQKHDVYASIIEVRGSADATNALGRGDRVILGLRSEASTFANHGQGNGYSDRIAVVWRLPSERKIAVFEAANTQPTAQYDANQQSNRDIIFRRADGEDVTGDHIPELGRLREGSYALLASTHNNPRSAGTNFALRPTQDAVSNGADMVERDSNHDGLFDANDTQRYSALNSSFLIHSGSRANTDSAGCQTIAPGDFLRFQQTVQGGNGQRVWQYVLTRVAP